jgi:hypothetical protein
MMRLHCLAAPTFEHIAVNHHDLAYSRQRALDEVVLLAEATDDAHLQDRQGDQRNQGDDPNDADEHAEADEQRQEDDEPSDLQPTGNLADEQRHEGEGEDREAASGGGVGVHRVVLRCLCQQLTIVVSGTQVNS